MKRLGVVVQRYGDNITGGAEFESRWVVQQLKDHFDITVFTTTAEDYITWKPSLKAGLKEIDGVKIRRFDVEEQRDFEKFSRYSDWILHENHRDADEARWLKMQGPYCPELVKTINAERVDFDLFLFFTYLYFPTVHGIGVVGNRAVLVPTAHDELPIYLRMYKNVFKAPLGFIFNAHAEHRFVDELFGLGHRPRIVVGMGIDWPDNLPDSDTTLQKYNLGARPFVISSGRISRGKGHNFIIENLEHLSEDIDIVFFGKLDMDLPDDPRVKFIGFVSEEEKWLLNRAASFSIHPSLYESLSITLLESWAVETPALVNARSHVLHDHIKASSAGLAYENQKDFVAHFNLLTTDASLLNDMGKKGLSYVKNNYQTKDVARKYIDFVNRMIELRTR